MLSLKEFDEELNGSLAEVRSIANSIRTHRFEHADSSWMQPYTVQAVLCITFRPPPALVASEDDERTDEERQVIRDAPLSVVCGMCLPHGYAQLQEKTNIGVASSASSASSSDASVTAASSSSSCAPALSSSSFQFVSPLIIKPSLHSLLQSISPVYAYWFEVQLVEKMNQLAQARDDSEEEELEEETVEPQS